MLTVSLYVLLSWSVYRVGGNQLVTKSLAQLWLFEPTGGSPDVVHLIKKQALRQGLRSCSVYRAYNAPMSKVVKRCQKLSKVVKSCQKLSKVVKSCQKLSKVVKSCQKMSKNVKKCQKLSKVVKSCQKLSKVVISCHKLSKVVKSCHKLTKHWEIQFWRRTDRQSTSAGVELRFAA